MQDVGAGLGDGVDDAAGGLAKLSAVIAVGDLEFLDGIGAVDIRDDDGASAVSRTGASSVTVTVVASVRIAKRRLMVRLSPM